jgi:hypothetical protein
METTRNTVTVTYAGSSYKLRFSRLPDTEFGPYDFAEAIGQLRVAALLDPIPARDLVLDANAEGSATASVG